MADRALDLLNAMGQTPDDIAAFLEGQGCKGYRFTPSLCPVANYLHQATGGGLYIVDGQRVSKWSPKGLTVTDLPKQVQSFVFNFDRGDFPSLVHPTNKGETK